MSGISVVILTRNEEQDLPGCLDSVAWSDDVHILDSESTDRTVEIARARGCTVRTRPFDNYAAQRNASMQLPFRHAWVLVLDADERPTPELVGEMQAAVAVAPAGVAAFRIRRRDFLWGTWLRHAQMTPFYVRLFRVGHVHYTRAINEVVEVSGEIVALSSPFDHFPFSRGMSHWLSKHNAYSSREAELLVSGGATRDASLRRALFARNFHERRVAQKAIFYELPCRPLIKWVYMMFVRGAVLDGRAGITYATLMGFYEFMIATKAQELRRSGRR